MKYIIIGIVLLIAAVIFTVVIFANRKYKCPYCKGPVEGIWYFVKSDRILYKCKKCGKEFIGD
jgi:DNA-directed RNA polymerase subunit RPC12/RpoP